MKVLHITNNFPTPNFPIFGIFVKEQIESLTHLGVSNEVFFMNSRDEGKKAYLEGLFKLRKHLRKNHYDLLHCHHSYSAIIFIFSGMAFGKKCILSYQNDPGKEGGKLLFLCRKKNSHARSNWDSMGIKDILFLWIHITSGLKKGLTVLKRL